jgi:hypothetical protein
VGHRFYRMAFECRGEGGAVAQVRAVEFDTAVA